MKYLKDSVRNLLRRWVIRRKQYEFPSYAQEGEDMVLRRIFESQSHGTFIDIGAHHPLRFSSTYYFYKQGWRGVSIEPNPLVQRDFEKLRPHDRILVCGVSSESNELNYFMFKEPAVNTFNPALASKRQSQGFELMSSQAIPVYTLSQLFENEFPSLANADFLNLDCQGDEISVLKSNNWNKYRPKHILVDHIPLQGKPMKKILESPIVSYLESVSYAVLYKTYTTLIFRDNNL